MLNTWLHLTAEFTEGMQGPAHRLSLSVGHFHHPQRAKTIVWGGQQISIFQNDVPITERRRGWNIILCTESWSSSCWTQEPNANLNLTHSMQSNRVNRTWKDIFRDDWVGHRLKSRLLRTNDPQVKSVKNFISAGVEQPTWEIQHLRILITAIKSPFQLSENSSTYSTWQAKCLLRWQLERTLTICWRRFCTCRDKTTALIRLLITQITSNSSRKSRAKTKNTKSRRSQKLTKAVRSAVLWVIAAGSWKSWPWEETLESCRCAMKRHDEEIRHLSFPFLIP